MRYQSGRARQKSVLIVAAALLLAGTATAAFAQNTTAPQTAQRTVAKRFDIAPQALDSAIAKFGIATGIQVIYDAQLASARRSPGVSGEFTPQQALVRLLAGTGLSPRFTSARTATIYDSNAANNVGTPGAITLDTVEVQGETATGPVDGYVATRSATGTKTDTPLIETPQSISVVTRDQIEAQKAESLKDALRYTAGVAVENRSAFTSADIMYGRGFALSRFLDGLKLQGDAAFIAPQAELYGIERVEVLRGPASVLYGQSSLGGVVNMVSKRPTDQPFHEIELQGGSFNSKQAAFDMGGPIDAKGEFLYRLTGLVRDADNQVDFVENQRFFIAPAFTWKPSTDTSLTILANYQRDPKAGLYNFVPYVGSVGPNRNGEVPRSFYAGDPNLNTIDRTQASIGYAFEHRFDDVWTIRQNMRYQDMSGDLNQVLPLFLMGDRRTLARYAQTTRDDISTFSLDNQAQAKFATGPLQHTVLFGLDYSNTKFTEKLAQDFAPSIDIFNPVYYQNFLPPDPATAFVVEQTEQKQQQVGVYAQDQIKIDRLTLLFSGRQDQVNTDNINLITDRNKPQDDGAFTYRAGSVYQFDNGLAPYVTTATSFNPSVGSNHGTFFEPTTGTLYEVGIKYQPIGMKSFVQLSVFDLTQQNVLTPTATPGFLTQIGEVSSRGVELEGKLSMTDRLDVTGAFSYLDPEVTKTDPSNPNGDLGKKPVNVPQYLASIWGDYTIRDGAFNGLGFGAGVRYTGETYADPMNKLSVPGYAVMDASLHYDLVNLNPSLKGARVALNVSNLFDERYVSNCSGTNCLYGVGRTVIGSLRYQW